MVCSGYTGLTITNSLLTLHNVQIYCCDIFENGFNEKQQSGWFQYIVFAGDVLVFSCMRVLSATLH